MEFGSVCAACFVAQLESSDQDVMKTTNILANISLSLCRRDASQTLSRFVTQSGISYASGDFIYLRPPWVDYTVHSKVASAYSRFAFQHYSSVAYWGVMAATVCM